MRSLRAKVRKAARKPPASTRVRTKGPGRLKVQHGLLNLQQTIGNRAVGGLLGDGGGGLLGGGMSSAPKTPVLSKGDRGEPVRKVQRALADLGFYAPPAKVDGIFGPLLKDAVERFQDDRGLSVDGIVGKYTQRELGIINELPVAISIKHQVNLVPQTTCQDCWSAAAAMVLGVNASIGLGKGILGPDGLTEASIPQFAGSHGLKVESQQSLSIERLAQLLTTGPLWVAGQLPTGHVVVISQMVGDGTAQNTFITVYDPRPVGKGSIWAFSVEQFFTRYPQATEYILHK